MSERAMTQVTLPALVTIPGVEILEVGQNWPAGTGKLTVTAEDLHDIVEAAQDSAVRTPIIKLGHSDPRFNPPGVKPGNFDGQPAMGRVENLRVSEDGMHLLGDFTGVPAWLALIMRHAYPSRSIEALRDYETPTGHKHPRVMTAVALLGETIPAVQTLADIPALFAMDSVEAVYSPESDSIPVAASEGEGVPSSIQASVNLEDVRRAYYDQQGPGAWAWIREMWSDFLIVDNEQGQLWRVPWSENDGAVKFGEPEAVRVEYVEDTAVAASAGDASLLTRYAIDSDSHEVRIVPQSNLAVAVEGQPVTSPASFSSAAEPVAEAPPSVPESSSDEETHMDEQTLRQMRTIFGLAEDGTQDAEIQARLQSLAAIVPTASDPASGGEGGEGSGDGGETDPTTQTQQPSTAPQAQPGQADPEAQMNEPVPTADVGQVGTVTQITSAPGVTPPMPTVAEVQPPAQPVAASQFTPPPGVRLVDEATYEELRQAALQGREARQQQVQERREAMLSAAVEQGRIRPADLDRYRRRFEQDAEGTEILLSAAPDQGGLEPGLVPVIALGHEGEGEDSNQVDSSLLMFPHLDQTQGA